MQQDGVFKIAIGKGRNEKKWKNVEFTWSSFVARVSETHRTAETYKEYNSFAKDRQDEIKDIGGFVGGEVVGGRRKKGSVPFRVLLTLDIDKAPADFWDDFELMYPGYAACLYSTHKHSDETPRYRLILPLNREAFPEEYEAVGRRVAGDLNIEYFDPTTFQVERLMYWPSTSNDGDFVFKEQDGTWLDVDGTLAKYRDWTDVSQWPVSARHKEALQRGIAKAGDPLEKEGVIGAFCRIYGIADVIEKFLFETDGSKIYTPTADPGRFSYERGSTAGGLVVYEDKFAYSHHGTDPAGGKLSNAFDLVRVHKFGLHDEDTKLGTPINKLPSFKLMQDFARKLPEVQAQLSKERVALLDGIPHFDGDWKEDNEEWMESLEYDKTGALKTNVQNIRAILVNDTNLRGKIRNNQFSRKTLVTSKLPWDLDGLKYPREWEDDDAASLREYLQDAPYELQSTAKIEDVLVGIKRASGYHPIKQYLNALNWDGVKRLDTLFIDFMGAEDTPYTRAVTRKSFVAAVTRIYRPGCKYDYVPVLVGAEGVGKSTVIRKMGRDWFSDTFNFGMISKGNSAFEQIQGYWLIEIPEMTGLKRSDAEAAKAFITSSVDNYRSSYGRETNARPRQCVFFGTANDPDFLQNVAGNRRYWPIPVLKQEPSKDVFSDLDYETVNQLWAEAKHYCDNNEPLFLSKNIEQQAREVQMEHTEQDDRRGIVEAWLDVKITEDWLEKSQYERVNYYNPDNIEPEGEVDRNVVTIAELWCECLGKRRSDMDNHSTRMLHKIMKSIPGWERSEAGIRTKLYGRQSGYVRKGYTGKRDFLV